MGDQERSRTDSWVPVAAVLLAAALGVVAWAATIGPGTLATGGRGASTATPTATASAARNDDTRNLPNPVHSTRGTSLEWLVVALQVLIGLLVLAGLVLLIRGVVRRFGERDRPEPRLDVDFEVPIDAEHARARAAADLDARAAALLDGSPRNGIVAIWAAFERTAAESGSARGASETPTEFITRFLHALDVDPRAVATLTGLYRVARFSAHPLDETHRDLAAEALDRIRADLAAGSRAARGTPL